MQVCFIKTTNLDGESNLKIRRPVDLKENAPDNVKEVSMSVHMTASPSADLCQHYLSVLLVQATWGMALSCPASCATIPMLCTMSVSVGAQQDAGSSYAHWCLH